MSDYDRSYGLKFVALRYFNAAGATPERGERHDPETHLIPLVLELRAVKAIASPSSAMTIRRKMEHSCATHTRQRSC